MRNLCITKFSTSSFSGHPFDIFVPTAVNLASYLSYLAELPLAAQVAAYLFSACVFCAFVGVITCLFASKRTRRNAPNNSIVGGARISEGHRIIRPHTFLGFKWHCNSRYSYASIGLHEVYKCATNVCLCICICT